MNVLMVTNTFTPHVGGVARSVESFTAQLRRLGHRVLVAAPSFDAMPESELDVIRLPALRNFSGSDFSLPLPVAGKLRRKLEEFRPDLVHSHHPFLLGDTALRIGAAHDVPIVFTYHTMYERYTHYLPGDSPGIQRFAVDLATGYCNLCDAVIAPSESVARILAERGVRVPVEVIPTGVEIERFATGDGPAFRAAHGIPADACVVGHVGRLAAEKNLAFLARALAAFAASHSGVRILIVGDGPSRDVLRETFERAKLGARLHLVGVLQGDALAGAYRAMDAFAFASHSETQGMVLTEAMAAGVPVVALDAPGAREVVRDRRNGRLLMREDVGEFCGALDWVCSLDAKRRRLLESEIAASARRFSMASSAKRTLALYEKLLDARSVARPRARGGAWQRSRRRTAQEWRLLAQHARAARHAWIDRAPPV